MFRLLGRSRIISWNARTVMAELEYHERSIYPLQTIRDAQSLNLIIPGYLECVFQTKSFITYKRNQLGRCNDESFLKVPVPPRSVQDEIVHIVRAAKVFRHKLGEKMRDSRSSTQNRLEKCLGISIAQDKGFLGVILVEKESITTWSARRMLDGNRYICRGVPVKKLADIIRFPVNQWNGRRLSSPQLLRGCAHSFRASQIGEGVVNGGMRAIDAESIVRSRGYLVPRGCFVLRKYRMGHVGYWYNDEEDVVASSSPRDVAILSIDKEIVDSCYLGFVLQLDYVKSQLKRIWSVSSSGTDIEALSRLKLPIPELWLQRRIVSEIFPEWKFIQNLQRDIEALDLDSCLSMERILFREYF